MIPFPALESLIARAYGSAAQGQRDGVVTFYTNAGGPPGRNWRVVGFYAAKTAVNRLVLEALHYEAPAMCLLRVYRERPLKILFARKWSGDPARFALAAEEAVAVFQDALPANPLPYQGDELDTLPISDEERARFRLALQPIPPPCTLDAIPAA